MESSGQRKKRILVTGGAGYIGSHTVVELIQSGHEVVITDNLCNAQEGIPEKIRRITGVLPTFIKCDLSDERAIMALFKECGQLDAVIHFAALKAVGESTEKPLMYYRNNLFSLVLLLEQMQKNSIRHFVFSSSCTVYGEPDALPVSEQSTLKKPESPYGHTKQMGEQILADCAATNSVVTIALRYFNPIGAHASAIIGEYPIGPPNNLVPIITQTTIGKRPPLLVNGNDYPTPDGSCIRDYIHVVDLAKAHVLAVGRLLNHRNESNFETFNLGTGRGYSVLETIQKFEQVNHVKVPYSIGPRRPGDVVAVYADTKKANEVLGWQSNLDLEEMLRSAWQWELTLKKESDAKAAH